MTTRTQVRRREVTVFLLTEEQPAWADSSHLNVEALASVDDCLGRLDRRGPSLAIVDGALLDAPDLDWTRSVEAVLGPVVVLADDEREIQIARDSGVARVLPRSFAAAPEDLAYAILDDLAGCASSCGEDLERYMRDAVHEFRTPLTTMIEFASLLEDGIGGPLEPRQHSYLNHILTASGRLVEQLDDYRDGIRLRMGSLHPRTRWVAVSELLTLAARPMSEDPGVSIHVDGEASHVWTDPDLLTCAIQRVMVGARKFGSSDAPLGLSAHLAAGEFVLLVNYDGSAPAENDCRLLDEGLVEHDGFYRSVTRVFGLGVGLADRFLRDSGGSLSLAKDASGGGVFTLRLPSDCALPE